MSSHLVQYYRQLSRLYQERGLVQVLHHLARALLSVLYHREAQYVLLKRVEGQETVRPVSGEESGRGIECVIVESAAALQEVVREVPATMRDSVDQLKARVEQGCIVLFAWRPQQSGASRELIGYLLCERGIFSALGRKRKVSGNILFVHYHEILPQYRGQRIADVMRGALDAYCRAQGLMKRCTVISPSNEPSLRSSLQAGWRTVGTVARVSILGGLYVWDTPWEQIENALRVIDDAERSSGGA